ncbi:MAG: hypothetical protein OJF52_000762 [Nitrospira sp.]|nr:MAG: hypothetical protein OJF52_000762 [Nitrospira sp.]
MAYAIERSDHEKETIRLISVRQASRKEREAYSRFTDWFFEYFRSHR